MAGKRISESHSLYDFGATAQEYDRWYDTRTGQSHDRAQKGDVLRLLRMPDPGDRLLDVGCGTGHWSRFFASMGYRVFGVDISDRMIAVARAAAHAGCVFHVADACSLPFEDASFEVTAAMAVLEFISCREGALDEMARCTKAGGSILIGTLNRLSPLNRQRLARGQEPYTSGRLLAPRELWALLAPFGTVRMTATPPSEGAAGAEEIVHCLEAQPELLSGPFLVAEVRKRV
ncbi:MAG: Demethylrebeccamycin-D-glucose O-methyltransferase [Syntrophaceae bacterium PtaU1.Bin231]|nr:MAG: Demethylrebeccamycin-D-glucose O-methyltransferase [Syntrophaceae bacterium PtaU1.Bin231]